jgi:uracil-DNA glycosylase
VEAFIGDQVDGSALQLAALHEKMRACCRCLEAGYPITPGAIFSGPTSARVMVVGQAPGVTEVTATRPFNASSGRRLFQWLAQVGWDEADFRATQYMTAVTKCYPGKPAGNKGKGDRVPTAAEQRLCAPFLERELEIVRPELIIPVGGLAIRRFLGQGRLVDVVGQVFGREGRTIVPLPHPSGASLWLNRLENQALVEQAIGHLRQLKQRLLM